MSESNPTDGKPNGVVGYRRPPVNRQFKPGQSGNPKGRPKGSKNFVTTFAEVLSRPIKVRDRNNGKARRVSISLLPDDEIRTGRERSRRASSNFPRRASWLEEFTAELLAFPGRHDDQVDALTQGLAWGRERRGEVSVKVLQGLY